MNIDLNKMLSKPFTEREISAKRKRAKSRVVIMISMLLGSLFLSLIPLINCIVTLTKESDAMAVPVAFMISLGIMLILFAISYMIAYRFLKADTIDNKALYINDFELADAIDVSIVEASPAAHDFYKAIKKTRDVYAFEYEIMKKLSGYIEVENKNPSN